MLKKLNTLIVRLKCKAQQNIFLDTDENHWISGEYPSLQHIIQLRKLQESRMVHNVHHIHGNPHTEKLLRTFRIHAEKVWKVQVEDENIRCMVESTCKTLPQAANYALDAPITLEDPYFAVKKGKTPSSWQWCIASRRQIHMGTIKNTWKQSVITCTWKGR